jgi:uncharacterized protein
MVEARQYTAFSGNKRVAHGDLHTTVLALKARFDRDPSDAVMVFDDESGRILDFDLRGTPEQALARLADHPALPKTEPEPPIKAGPGRPKLGVVAKEVTLLPRHWEWLERQPGGISVTLRKLVEEAKKTTAGRDAAKKAREAIGHFMWTMGGNLPNFEEASRALYAKEDRKLESLIKRWPADVRHHVEWLLEGVARLDKKSSPELVAGEL